MSEQTKKVPVTPAQRWALFNLSHAKANEVKGQEGRVLRRFMRAFGLTAIREALIKHGRVNDDLFNDETPALFDITDENRDYALKLDREVDRHASSEMVLGDLFDELEKTKDRYHPPEDVAAFDAKAEDWTPAPEEHQDLVDEIADRVHELSTEQLRSVLGALPRPEPKKRGATEQQASA